MVFRNKMTHVFYKCVQLVHGVIMLISITIILLCNFEKKKHLVRLSVSSVLQNQFPLSVYCLLCFVLQRKTEKKNLQLTSINFVYMRLPELRRIARVAMAHCSEKQSLKWYNPTISKYIKLIFCYVMRNITYVKIMVKKG